MRHGQNSTGTSQPSEEGKDCQFHSTAWKPRFTATTTTAGVWFMFIIPPCPPKRSRERNNEPGLNSILRWAARRHPGGQAGIPLLVHTLACPHLPPDEHAHSALPTPPVPA